MGRKRKRAKHNKPTQFERKQRRLERGRSIDTSFAAARVMGHDPGSLSSPEPARDLSASAPLKASAADPVFDAKPLHEMTMDEAKRTPYDYYRHMGVLVDCDQRQITEAYRKLMMVHHPDKGGSDETSKIINHANSWLQYTFCRKQYDEQGLER
ncbi:unnamed protein product [Ectocarpus sp. 6 AP-2014]